jgi:hypothetical protein
MDVPGKVEIATITQKLLVFAYQFWLIIAFLLGGKIGKYMTQKFASISNHNPPYFEEITASRNYPYFYYYKNMIFSLLKRERRNLSGYMPSVPVVYLYGKKKPFHFHGNKWLTLLQ